MMVYSDGTLGTCFLYHYFFSFSIGRAQLVTKGVQTGLHIKNMVLGCERAGCV